MTTPLAQHRRAAGRPRRVVLLRMTPWGGEALHGGALRSQQLTELVRRFAPAAIHHTADHPRTARRSALPGLALAAASRAAAGRTGPLQGLFTAWLDRELAALGLAAGDVVLFDADRRYGPALARVARRRGLSFHALPHNIEALIPVTWPIAPDPVRVAAALAGEIAWLARAETVWAIGVFDRDLLRLLGLAAELLPYAPPAPRRDELAALRDARQSGGPLLVLGTVHNSPTRAGMLEQLAMLRDRSIAAGLPPVIVAGHGTELLADAAPPGVEVRGSQSWSALRTLLGTASALWAHQSPMPGALTRVTEALIAGLPVIANRWAALGLQPTPGLVGYARPHEIAPALAALPLIAPMPDLERGSAGFSAMLAAIAEG